LIFAATPAKKWESAERGASAGSVCDEFVALATDEEQNEPDEAPQPAGSRFLAGVAVIFEEVYNVYPRSGGISSDPFFPPSPQPQPPPKEIP